MRDLGDTAARRWLIAFAVLCGLAAVSSAMQWTLLRDALIGAMSDESADANDTREAVVGIAHFVVMLCTYVVVGRFLYRTSQRLHAVAGASMEFTPGWTIGWFFVPVASLFKPYEAVREMWQVSAPPAEGRLPSATDVPAAFRWWWGLWLVDSVFSIAVLRSSADSTTIEGLMTTSVLDGISALLALAAVFPTLWLVRNLAARTTQRELGSTFD
ncbi:MAG: DUF4328 domain-containing protein [Myxococcota bacterium]